MEAFLANAFAFPTVIFTVPTIVILLFWMTALLGFADIEMFDLDVDVEAPESGVADIDGDATDSSDLLSKLGLDGVPLTIAVTLVDLYAWAFCYVAKQNVAPLLEDVLTATAAGGVVAVGAVVVALPAAAISCRPLRRVFVTHEAPSKADFVGKICRVTTSRVDAAFGQAESEDGTVVVNVRADGDGTFAKGDCVVLIDYDEVGDTFVVTAHDELMGGA